ncbi:MAG: DUF4082 domain-containing protein, partial [Chromatiales bacterium]|nr:DUF4082 domain-containing protein [Chromatiales bacterium]
MPAYFSRMPKLFVLSIFFLFSLYSAIANAACPCSVWDSAATPAVSATHDDDAVSQGIELGMKFRTTEDGNITAIRFYKSSENTGTHTGTLWSASGTSLGTVTFTGETASGWQEAALATPVAVTADTVYVVSYHTATGFYSSTSGYFTATGVDNGSLHALKDGEDGEANGVFLYGPSGFPNQFFQGGNYWVDVVFDSGVDTTAPTVTGRVPVASATGVSPSLEVQASFSESLDPATVSNLTFELRDAGNNSVPAQVTYDAGYRVARLLPLNLLGLGQVYTVILRGGLTGSPITDVAGNALAADVSWSFTIATTSPCTANKVAAENCLLGSPQSEWDVVGAGDPSIQGFATQFSLNHGETVRFKV